MPVTGQVIPSKLKPFTFHKVDLDYKGEGQVECVATCPFCTKEDKLSINSMTGQWRCFSCNAGKDNSKVSKGGNIHTFLEMLWKTSYDGTGLREREELAKERGLLSPGTPLVWGAATSITTTEWLLPTYTDPKKFHNLYRYVNLLDKGKWRHRLMVTPEVWPSGKAHGLFGVNLYDKGKPIVYLCEGPWDAMALWEVLVSSKLETQDEGGDGKTITLTSNPEVSLLSRCNVLAVPGCGTFNLDWLHLFRDKQVVVMYDSDHPRRHPTTGQVIPSAGYESVKRVAQILLTCEEPAAEVKFVKWGKDGYDPNLPDGVDIRDLLSGKLSGDPLSGSHMKNRVVFLKELLSKIEPVPEDWVAGRTVSAIAKGGSEIECKPCSDWTTVVNAWRKAMKWTEGLDRSLSVMMACCASTEAVGDQLWIKIVGPPASGKSTLCEALSTNKKYILAKSTIRGFHSGFQSSKAGKGEDNSLLSQLKNKTLITKDGDTLLQAPNLKQILSEARDVYDRTSRTHYRNRMSNDYEGISMTWLLCGTSSLRTIDSSELGERFLDCVIVEDIDEDLEDEIGWRVANRAERDMSFLSDGKMETRDAPEMVLAKQLTGGYISWLRTNVSHLLKTVKVSDVMLKRCQHLAKFVAYMRARPSKEQEEKAEREMSFRLIGQLVRLMKCLAVVLNRKNVDNEVMRRVSRVAMDTARGRTMELIKHLYHAGDTGLSTKELTLRTNKTEEKQRALLRFLREIKVVDFFEQRVQSGIYKKARWKLTKRMQELYREVTGEVMGKKPEDAF